MNLLRFTEKEKEEFASWSAIFMRAQLGRFNEIINKDAFQPDNVREVILRYLNIDIDDQEGSNKLEKLMEIVEENFDLDKLGVLFMLMSMDDRIREEINLSVLYSD